MGLLTPLLKQTVATVYDSTIDGFGDASYAATLQEFDEISVKCRIVLTPKYLYSPTGVAEIAKVQAWFEPDVNIDEGSRVRYNGSNYEVVSVEEKLNLKGEVEFKKVLLR